MAKGNCGLAQEGFRKKDSERVTSAWLVSVFFQNLPESKHVHWRRLGSVDYESSHYWYFLSFAW